ncbi:unnamed protein product [Pieris macdunnoughi]|uniref:Uncharacterized protein n=1 Tax=Pieris macdunnoughi TaxID=345717 RepID=A0A821X5D9_9NEOP|nr:unnamed protein product [Pieris macdunnoughi]
MRFKSRWSLTVEALGPTRGHIQSSLLTIGSLLDYWFGKIIKRTEIYTLQAVLIAIAGISKDAGSRHEMNIG